MTIPNDPFEARRRSDGVMHGRVAADEFVMVLRHHELKSITRDWETFTSDAPFHVPIPSEEDVRTVRQLPIETDPPAHGAYRSVVKDLFSRQRSNEIQPVVEGLVETLVEAALDASSVEVVHDVAIPLQSRSLAAMLGRPQSEADEWISWGTHVFRDHGAPDGHATSLDRYLNSAIDDALVEPGDDFFGLLARAVVDGRALSREEMLGFANLTFAGGRDTMIHLVVNCLVHLSGHPDVIARLRGEPQLAAQATEEYLRFSSPITHIGRIATCATELSGQPIEAGQLVSLGFASANRDESVFERPNEIVLDRKPNRHVAFGHGPHTCLGAPHARMTLCTLLQVVASRVETLELIDATEKVEDLGSVRRIVSVDPATLRFHRRGRGRAGQPQDGGRRVPAVPLEHHGVRDGAVPDGRPGVTARHG